MNAMSSTDYRLLPTVYCSACPCPEICVGGVLCQLASDPARHAHIHNVSALKLAAQTGADGDTTKPAPTLINVRRTGGSTTTPCCGG